jgi:hypothetical protein
MKKRLSRLSVFFVVVAMTVGSSMTFRRTEPAHAAGSAPVVVTNTPLPVSAAQSGSWTVDVAGMPAVNVATLPAVQVGGGSVAVRNVTGTTLDVLAAESPAMLRTLVKTVCAAGSSVFSCGGVPTVADAIAGEYWVIDQVSGSCSALAGTTVIAVTVVVDDATGVHGYPLPLTYPSSAAPLSGVFFERTRIVTSPLTGPLTASVRLSIQFASVPQDAFCHATIAGHRVASS